MASYQAPLEDMQFLIRDVFKVQKQFADMPETAEISEDLVTAIVTEAAKIAEGTLAPCNQSGDQEGCRFDNGKVTTPKGFKEAYRTFAEGGWAGLTGDPRYDGQGMPKLLSALIEEMFFAANSSFALYTILNTGATLTLSEHASAELKARFLPKMYSGVWSGTMCLTESHAGTDLSMIKTKAIAAKDGSYRLSGTKMFITAGEHDLTENIIHLVLAKVPDAPPGPRGISLFLVPKMQVGQSGELTGEANNVACGSIEHKMGIRASATCVINFDAATAYLVGEENKGLSSMFTMMNYERLSMGLQGNGLADASYQVASAYAKQRLQGRAPGGSLQPELAADPLIVHPDVRRMLLTIRANVMAGRALSLYAALQLDTTRFHPDPARRKRAAQLVALLIPVQKAYCTDRGFEACVLAQQVLGGHGYVSEWGLEQNVRDARIAQIYEGANGIQALDLTGRKTVHCNGELLAVLLEEIDEFADNHKAVAGMQTFLPALVKCRDQLRSCTALVVANAAEDPAEIGAASYAYMELMGLTLYCFMWQRILAACLESRKRGAGDAQRLLGLIGTGKFFMARMLPKSVALAHEIDAGSVSLMAMTAEQF